MDVFFCEKLLGRLLHLEEEEECFWDTLLKRGEFEVELLVEQLLENSDLVVEEEEGWLLEPVSFFDTFHFSSMSEKQSN